MTHLTLYSYEMQTIIESLKCYIKTKNIPDSRFIK